MDSLNWSELSDDAKSAIVSSATCNTPPNPNPITCEPPKWETSDIKLKVVVVSSGASGEQALAIARIFAELDKVADIQVIVQIDADGGPILHEQDIPKLLKESVNAAEAIRPFVSRQEGAKLRDQYRGRSKYHSKKL